MFYAHLFFLHPAFLRQILFEFVAGFQSLVSLLSDRPHQGLALFEYTRVPQLWLFTSFYCQLAVFVGQLYQLTIFLPTRCVSVGES